MADDPFDPLNSDRLMASAARYLIDGGEEDAASVLLACSMDVWPSGDTWWHGDEVVEAVHVALTAPRAAYEALQRETKLEAYMDAMGVPHEVREDQVRGSLVLIPSDAELAPIVRPAIERAISAVLPHGYYVKHFTEHVELVDIDPDWRNELLTIARGKGITNQGVAFKDRPLYTWKNLRFRSKTEMRIAQALDRAKVLFFPNSMARLGLVADTRENREPDFLVCDAGKWGILEVHGDLWHPATRATDDHERARLFKAHGIKVVESYDATRCYEKSDEVVAGFLHILRQQ
jgi:hypothetical protein